MGVGSGSSPGFGVGVTVGIGVGLFAGDGVGSTSLACALVIESVSCWFMPMSVRIPDITRVNVAIEKVTLFLIISFPLNRTELKDCA